MVQHWSPTHEACPFGGLLVSSISIGVVLTKLRYTASHHNHHTQHAEPLSSSLVPPSPKPSHEPVIPAKAPPFEGFSPFLMGADTYCALCGALANYMFWLDDPDFSEDGPSDPFTPGIISREDCEWLGNVHILSENPKTSAFLSGRVKGNDLGFYCREDGGDFPTGEHAIPTYTGGHGETLFFPVHSECYDQLCLALAPEPVDLDVLYQTFKAVSKKGYASSLNLDYGAVKECMRQFWEAQVGTEDFVTAPSSDTALLDFYQALIRDSPQADDQRFLVTSKIGPVSEDVSVSDPFYKLSPELALQTMYLLDTSSVRRWRASSRPIAQISLGNGFQRSRVYHDKPWLYDLCTAGLGVDWGYVNRKLDLVSSRPEKVARQMEEIGRETRNKPRRQGREPQVDYQLCIRDWSDMNVKLTNRRRIWGVIDQVLDLYCPRKAAKERERRD
ncbi:hypothetical protein FSARC_1302 [Fusarium sarcochroum]|uniref:Uncharacterized protein n=1 Tax=Fusarium sarcochroum TaxID=1208366 RepID=A0A8H4XFB8_9HYPO|nr:hypothetical protein FSARC_1302 [Fusarium sarcochroum]